MRRRASTLIEMLVVVAVIGLLIASIVPSLLSAHQRSVGAKCAGNLHQVGVLIYSFLGEHKDTVAPCVRDFDYYWDREPQIGWDIRTGTWAGVPGGAGTIWSCPAQRTPFVGNARALGLDTSYAKSGGPVYLVGPRFWKEPSKLVLAHDVQADMIEPPWPYAHAVEPRIGDLSDENVAGWARDDIEIVHPMSLDILGPHHGQYGVLFADAHAGIGYPQEAGLLYYSGRRWWE